MPKPWIAALLLALVAPPQLSWLAAQALEHHDTEEEGRHRHFAAIRLAATLLHGHEHDEDVPDHEHHLVPAPPVRLQAQPGVATPGLAPAEAPEPASLAALRFAVPYPGPRLPGAGPPRLHRLCTLLI